MKKRDKENIKISEKKDLTEPKKYGMGKLLKIFLIIFLVFLLLGLGFYAGANYKKFDISKFFKKSATTNSQSSVQTHTQVNNNPLKDIIASNTINGKVDNDKVVQQGIKEFNTDYINYLLIGLGVGDLHKSALYGNPVIEFNLDNDLWKSEVVDGRLNTAHLSADKKDLIIKMSKEEAVRALLSSDIKLFMKNSVTSGNTQIEMVAGKMELLSKGYLDMYQKLSG